MHDDVERLLQAGKFDAALERLLHLYGKKVFGLALSILKDTGRAEDATQDAFLKIWRALPTFNGRAGVSTWLYTIARNTCLTAVRAESYRRTAPLDETSGPAAVDSSTRDLALHQALARLPEMQRTVITLFYLEDKSVQDVAAMLDLPENTVKSHLHRARRALSALLE
jgi:RNA polymerase sigma-70 factor, ECF subfamily